VVEAVNIPVAVAGGLNSETAPLAVEAGAEIIIVGGAVTKAPDATEATRTILQAMRSGEAVATDLYKRGGAEELREIFSKCTAANVSDAMHRKGWLPGINSISSGLQAVGPALTVWTYPGDWAKPVEAIDQAEPGQVLVVDVRGQGPAVWGEEATKSCLQTGIAGIVAGDPKGMGIIGVTLKIGETMVRTGDWVIADDDGVVVVPQERVVDIANRALAVVEREGREKAEIDAGSTLGKVVELERWEQQRADTTSADEE